MRSFKLITLALLFLLFYAASCDSDDDNDTLPRETQDGRNTFGCLVNGKVWEKGGDLSFPHPNLGAFVGENEFGITASRFGNNIFQTISIDVAQPLKVDTYSFNNNECIASFSDRETDCYYQTYLHYIGKLEITKFDSVKKIISGRFNFKAFIYNADTINSAGTCDSSITITEGRFDIHYIP